MNIDFGPADLKFRIYNNEPTVFDNPTKSSVEVNDDPFVIAISSGIPANAGVNSAPPVDFWTN